MPPTDDNQSSSTEESPQGAGRPTRQKLPIGPLGLLVVTAIALAGAFGVAWVVLQAATSDGNENEAVDVTDVLGNASVESVSLGEPLPEVALEYLDGTNGQVSDYLGQPLVINFWSSTCAPCLAEMPDFEAVHTDLAGQVAFVGVDVQDTAEAGRKMIEQTGVTYPNARDPQAEIMTAFGGIALPRTVFVDQEGVVVATHSGAMTADDLKTKLAENELISS